MGFRLLQIADVRWWNAGAHYAVSLSAALAESGHEVVVAGLPESPPLLRARSLGLRTEPVPGLDERRPAFFPRAVAALARMIARERFDLVNAHRGAGHLAAALALSGRRAIPLVRTRGDIRAPRVHPLSRRLYTRWTSRVILSGDFMRKDYGAFGIPCSKLSVIRGGVDLERFHPAADRVAAKHALGFAQTDLLVGIIARLSPVKGHMDFLEAAALAHRSVPATRFVVVGSESQIRWPELAARARELGIEDAVTYLGEVRDVRPVMAALDIGVVASRGSEAICRVAFEYLASGVPIVAARAGVLPEIIEEGVSGLVVPVEDPAALSAAVRSLAENDGLRARLAGGARRSAEERFGVDRFRFETEAVYREALHV